MRRALPLCSSTTARYAVGATLGLLSLLSACSDFTPGVGRLLPTCPVADGATVDAAPSGSGTYGSYGGYATTGQGCFDAGSDAASNSILANAGVTGNVLIADQLDNRVIVVDRQGNILWQFGNGDSVPGPSSIVAPNDAELLPTNEVLMAGTGTPVGGEPGCRPGGCVDDRVIIVDYSTKQIVWQFGGHAGGSGSGQLTGPTSAVLVPTASGDHVLISDQGNGRVVEVDRTSKQIVWQFPRRGDGGSYTCSPQSAERLLTGNTLIADQGGNRIVEVSPPGEIVWQYPEVINVAALNFPSSASRLPDGHTLIADTNNNRVLELDDQKNIVWSYLTITRTPLGNASLATPTSAVRLANQHTLVTLIEEDQVIEVDHATSPNVVYTHGELGVAGGLPGLLNQPYDAKVVGDFTGLTSP
jgi:hypothetical protein